MTSPADRRAGADPSVRWHSTPIYDELTGPEPELDVSVCGYPIDRTSGDWPGDTAPIIEPERKGHG